VDLWVSFLFFWAGLVGPVYLGGLTLCFNKSFITYQKNRFPIAKIPKFHIPNNWNVLNKPPLSTFLVNIHGAM
jgi:hypothetical protein